MEEPWPRSLTECVLLIEKTIKTQILTSYFMEFAFIILTRIKCHKGQYTVHVFTDVVLERFLV